MARACQVTGTTPGFGHRVSHSHRRTKRRFDVKNRRNDPDRLVMRKYDPRIRQHVDFREER